MSFLAFQRTPVPPKRFLGDFQVDPRQNDAQNGPWNSEVSPFGFNGAYYYARLGYSFGTSFKQANASPGIDKRRRSSIAWPAGVAVVYWNRIFPEGEYHESLGFDRLQLVALEYSGVWRIGKPAARGMDRRIRDIDT